uniref:Uncharacterized protein n=1 Tax=Strombidium inclinatum TaxID=197538 RepID=A0A7S3ISB2_9SPIT|mmetsp:Transcript_37051/g.56821  ORF Transcript_37051/g.56821 Transcript_37051/m.56821 type:complete len:153 (+) Transcript_37051:179-637(+)
MEGNQCYSKDKNAWAIEYENTEDVTKQFYLLANAGLVMLLVSVLMYYLQGKENMFELMRPYVIITNLLTLVWFITLQYYRFKKTGRACSGDYLQKVPDNFKQVYIADEGRFFMYYIIAHYFVYVVQKIISICITNSHETEYERKRSLALNKV